MKTIAFHSNQLSVTGTEVALYDYAHHNATLLGNRSVILYNRLNPNNKSEALDKFCQRFQFFPTTTPINSTRRQQKHMALRLGSNTGKLG